jgi:hypothetical protein
MPWSSSWPKYWKSPGGNRDCRWRDWTRQAGLDPKRGRKQSTPGYSRICSKPKKQSHIGWVGAILYLKRRSARASCRAVLQLGFLHREADRGGGRTSLLQEGQGEHGCELLFWFLSATPRWPDQGRFPRGDADTLLPSIHNQPR